MTEEGFKAAAEAVESGKFSQAKERFGALLEENPETSAYECGYYCASYWNNRTDLLDPERPGRRSATTLVQEWDAFEEIARKKGYAEQEIFRLVMRVILGKAADHFRLAFQTEGANSGDINILLEITQCLLRIEDYRNGAEILHYIRRLSPEDPHVLFLLGETSCHPESGESIESGASSIRDALIIEPTVANEKTFFAGLLREVLESVHEFVRDENDEREWFGPFFMLHVFHLKLRRQDDREIRSLIQEFDRLASGFENTMEQYKNRVGARIAFYAMVLLHFFLYQERDNEMVHHCETTLKRVAPAFYALYEEAKKEQKLR